MLVGLQECAWFYGHFILLRIKIQVEYSYTKWMRGPYFVNPDSLGYHRSLLLVPIPSVRPSRGQPLYLARSMGDFAHEEPFSPSFEIFWRSHWICCLRCWVVHLIWALYLSVAHRWTFVTRGEGPNCKLRQEILQKEIYTLHRCG